MTAPGSAFYGKIAMKECPSPCTPDCLKRNAVCHVEGNCKAHDEWRLRYAVKLEEVKRRYDGDRTVGTMLAEKRTSKRYQMVVAYNRKVERTK